MPSACFCEAIRHDGFAQPANTLSSFSFVVIALAVGIIATRDRAAMQSLPANPLNRQLAYPGVFIFALIIVGLGSAAFHATLTFNSQFADVLGMYLIAMFIVLYNVNRLQRLENSTMVAAYLGSIIVLASILYFAPEFRRYIFASLLVLALSLEWAYRRTHTLAARTRFLGMALLLIVAGFAIWVADITHILCNPTIWMQGHAIWHVCGALALGFLYLYYRSETAELKPNRRVT
jgi:hypothetical protein